MPIFSKCLALFLIPALLLQPLAWADPGFFLAPRSGYLEKEDIKPVAWDSAALTSFFQNDFPALYDGFSRGMFNDSLPGLRRSRVADLSLLENALSRWDEETQSKLRSLEEGSLKEALETFFSIVYYGNADWIALGAEEFNLVLRDRGLQLTIVEVQSPSKLPAIIVSDLKGEIASVILPHMDGEGGARPTLVRLFAQLQGPAFYQRYWEAAPKWMPDKARKREKINREWAEGLRKWLNAATGRNSAPGIAASDARFLISLNRFAELWGNLFSPPAKKESRRYDAIKTARVEALNQTLSEYGLKMERVKGTGRLHLQLGVYDLVDIESGKVLTRFEPAPNPVAADILKWVQWRALSEEATEAQISFAATGRREFYSKAEQALNAALSLPMAKAAEKRIQEGQKDDLAMGVVRDVKLKQSELKACEPLGPLWESILARWSDFVSAPSEQLPLLANRLRPDLEKVANNELKLTGALAKIFSEQARERLELMSAILKHADEQSPDTLRESGLPLVKTPELGVPAVQPSIPVSTVLNQTEISEANPGSQRMDWAGLWYLPALMLLGVLAFHVGANMQKEAVAKAVADEQAIAADILARKHWEANLAFERMEAEIRERAAADQKALEDQQKAEQKLLAEEAAEKAARIEKLRQAANKEASALKNALKTALNLYASALQDKIEMLKSLNENLPVGIGSQITGDDLASEEALFAFVIKHFPQVDDDDDDEPMLTAMEKLGREVPAFAELNRDLFRYKSELDNLFSRLTKLQNEKARDYYGKPFLGRVRGRIHAVQADPFNESLVGNLFSRDPLVEPSQDSEIPAAA